MRRKAKSSSSGNSFDIAESILAKLNNSKEALDEVFLSDKWDPLLASRVLSTLVERDVLILVIDDKEVGGKRRKYLLKETNNAK